MGEGTEYKSESDIKKECMILILGYALGSNFFIFLKSILAVFASLFYRECGSQMGKGIMLGQELIGRDAYI